MGDSLKVIGKVAGTVLTGGLAAPLLFKGIGGGKKAQKPPGVPTIDDAAVNQQMSDRIRLRRGVLQNIYGGATGGTPSVGTKQLLGS
jgi:hypothetical protein